MSSTRLARSGTNPLQATKTRTHAPVVRRNSGSSTGSFGASVSGGDDSQAPGAGVAPSSAPRGSKLRANRERRRRERSIDEDDLDNKFSDLSVSAPAFTPSGMRAAPSLATAPHSSVAAPTASWLAKAKPPQRRVPPAHQRQQQQQQKQHQQQQHDQQKRPNQPATPVPKQPTPMSQWSSSTAAAAATGTPRSLSALGDVSLSSSSSSPADATPSERRPRRQRIGTLGFARTGMSMNRRTPQAAPPPSGAFGSSFQLSSTQSSSSSVVDSTASHASDAATHGRQRKRSDSTGSDSEYSSDDEVYPDEAAAVSSGSGLHAPSAFPERLMLLSQQKKVSMSVVSRDSVIDTVFSALFTKKDTKKQQQDGSSSIRRFSVFGDDTSGTETDEPNEDFVKRGLAASLFKDSLHGLAIPFERMGAGMTDQEAVDRFLTPPFIHTLVNDLRFEDSRMASARIDILRAIHKSCPSKRIHIARAMADAATLRLQYVIALAKSAQEIEMEKSKVMVKHINDHSNGFIELLRYAIEHIGESVSGLTGESTDPHSIAQRQAQEIVRNYLATLVSLWKTHWYDPSGSDDEELISCAGQFVAYLPHASRDVLERLVTHWPNRFPPMEVIAIRMMARVVMTSPPLHTLDDTRRLPLRIFAKLAKCVQSAHTQVAQEALAFTGCQFAMVHFLGQYEEIYTVVSEAFHRNAQHHWNEAIRTTSEGHFDRALDYAP